MDKLRSFLRTRARVIFRVCQLVRVRLVSSFERILAGSDTRDFVARGKVGASGATSVEVEFENVDVLALLHETVTFHSMTVTVSIASPQRIYFLCACLNKQRI